MGAILHPRLFNGALDIKMFAEVRLSWYLLFTLTTSATLARHAETGVWEPGLLYSMGAHFLYTNACAKGEHYIPPTWDITYEKYGWMLCFWNWAGEWYEVYRRWGGRAGTDATFCALLGDLTRPRHCAPL